MKGLSNQRLSGLTRVRDLRVGFLFYFVGRVNVYARLGDTASHASSTHMLVACSEVIPEIDRLSPALAGACSDGHAEDLLRDFSQRWGRRLLPAATALAVFDILVIVPHSILHGLPLHAVQIDGSAVPLITSHAIVYAPSATTAARSASRNPARHSAFSTWAFSLDGSAAAENAPLCPRRGFALTSDAIRGNPAQYERVGAAFAARFADGVVLPGKREALKALLVQTHNGVDALCLVCHGYYHKDNPARNGILLTSSAGGILNRFIILPEIGSARFRDLPFDYFPPQVATESDMPGDIVTVEELGVDAHVNSQLVALIGCSTAAGSLVEGDRFLSIAVQWLNIGAVSVLASSWSIDVRYAEAWLPHFLERWLALRQPKAIAYQEAVREEIQTNCSPIFHWSAFVLYGDWI